MMMITSQYIIGRTFLCQPRDSGERNRARVVESISDHDNHLESNPERITFLCSFNDEQCEKIYAYNDIIRHIKKDNDNPDIWKFKHTTAHEVPLKNNHPNYK